MTEEGPHGCIVEPRTGSQDEIAGHGIVINCAETCEIPASGERHRWMFTFRVDGDLRFISHHDTLRLFRRALARAEVPVRYSEGFNPHPRIAIPLPRPVGVASQAEAIVVETERSIDPDETLARLQRYTPADLRILEARRLEVGVVLQPDLVRYRLEVDEPPAADWEARISRVLQCDTIPVERKAVGEGGPRLVDVRPYLVDLRTSGGAVEFTLQVTGGGSAKPAEIAGLLGYDAASINHRIRRLEVKWR